MINTKKNIELRELREIIRQKLELLDVGNVYHDYSDKFKKSMSNLQQIAKILFETKEPTPVSVEDSNEKEGYKVTLPTPQMRLYGLLDSPEKVILDTKEELIKYIKTYHPSQKDIYTIDFLGNALGKQDVIRVTSESGIENIYIVYKEGIAIYNPRYNLWEATIGDLKTLHKAFRDRGITFENDVYATSLPVEDSNEEDYEVALPTPQMRLYGLLNNYPEKVFRDTKEELIEYIETYHPSQKDIYTIDFLGNVFGKSDVIKITDEHGLLEEELYTVCKDGIIHYLPMYNMWEYISKGKPRITAIHKAFQDRGIILENDEYAVPEEEQSCEVKHYYVKPRKIHE